MEELEVVAGKVFDVIGVADIAIAQMDAQYLNLKIKDVTDKEGYEAVHEGKMAYVHTRTKVEKKGLELRKKAKATIEDYLVAEKKEETRILNLLKPGEVRLTEEEKAYTDALETIRLEQIRQEELRIQNRRDRLAGLGVGFNGQVWSFAGKQTPDLSVRLQTDDEFEATFIQYQRAVECSNERAAAEMQAIKNEEARLAKLKAEQEDASRRIALQEQALRDAIVNARQKQEEWEAARAAEAKAIEDAKQKAIEDKARAIELEHAKQEAAERAVRDLEEKIQREAEEAKLKAEKERITAERKAARAPDREKLLKLATDYDEMGRNAPIMKTDEGALILGEFATAITDAIEKVRAKAGEL